MIAGRAAAGRPGASSSDNLAMFGLTSLTARVAHARDLGEVLERHPRRPVPAGAIPTSSQVLGPVSDAAAICSADSVQSVSPAPVRRGRRPAEDPALRESGFPSGAGMVNVGRQHRGKI